MRTVLTEVALNGLAHYQSAALPQERGQVRKVVVNCVGGPGCKHNYMAASWREDNVAKRGTALAND